MRLEDAAYGDDPRYTLEYVRDTKGEPIYILYFEDKILATRRKPAAMVSTALKHIPNPDSLKIYDGMASISKVHSIWSQNEWINYGHTEVSHSNSFFDLGRLLIRPLDLWRRYFKPKQRPVIRGVLSSREIDA
jgi:hypothetical protein